MNEMLAKVLGEEHVDLYPHKTEEKYPRIVEKIALLWGSPATSKYFSEILFDDRGGREGFPADVMMELFRLSNHHESVKPARDANKAAWDSGDVMRMDQSRGPKN